MKTRASPPNKYRVDSRDVPANGNPSRADCMCSAGKFLDSAQPSIFRPSVAGASRCASSTSSLVPLPAPPPPSLVAFPGCRPPFSVLRPSIDTFLRLSPLFALYPFSLLPLRVRRRRRRSPGESFFPRKVAFRFLNFSTYTLAPLICRRVSISPEFRSRAMRDRRYNTASGTLKHGRVDHGGFPFRP